MKPLSPTTAFTLVALVAILCVTLVTHMQTQARLGALSSDLKCTRTYEPAKVPGGWALVTSCARFKAAPRVAPKKNQGGTNVAL